MPRPVWAIWPLLAACQPSPPEPGWPVTAGGWQESPGEQAEDQAVGLVGAGVRPGWWPDLASSGALPEPDEVVDVLVIGGGPAGLAAATEAREAGASVRLLERDSAVGGSLLWSQLMLLSGTPIQGRSHIDDGPDRLLAEWADFTGGDPEEPWVRRFAEENVPEVFDWLLARGARFSLLVDRDDSSGATARVHAFDAETVLGALSGDLGGAVRLEVEAQGLVTGVRSGALGVAFTDLDTGQEGWVQASAVVVATGGFLRDLDLVSALNPAIHPDAVHLGSGPNADGAWHRLLTAAGARWKNPTAIGVYAHGVPDPRDPAEELAATGLDRMLWFNAEGRRFTNETADNSFFTGQDLLDQPGHLGWAVYDALRPAGLSVDDVMQTPGEVGKPGLDELRAARILVCAESLELLADQLGVDGGAMREEIDAWNAEILEGSPDPWRGLLSSADEPYSDGPVCALELAATLAKSFGGLEVDLDGRLLDASGAAIPGLFAAGELVGMAGGSLVGQTGFTGSMSAVILSGRVAGASAADQALR